MEGRHPKLYDEAFGADRAFWVSTSPAHRLQTSKAVPRPMLLVCSSRREQVCPQAQDHARKLRAQGGEAVVVEQPLTHREINQQLGLPGRYTEQVDRFIDGLLR
jgi:arylformamidase